MSSLPNRKLLVADDSVTVQKVVDLTFGDEGYAVTAVGDGRQALEAIERDVPDVVLADVTMPGTNGYELCARIKRDERSRHVPVILLVGAFEIFNEAEARACGADDVLTKPFQSIREMVNKVGNLLGGKRDARDERLIPRRSESVAAETAPAESAAEGAESSAPHDVPHDGIATHDANAIPPGLSYEAQRGTGEELSSIDERANEEQSFAASAVTFDEHRDTIAHDPFDMDDPGIEVMPLEDARHQDADAQGARIEDAHDVSHDAFDLNPPPVDDAPHYVADETTRDSSVEESNLESGGAHDAELLDIPLTNDMGRMIRDDLLMGVTNAAATSATGDAGDDSLLELDDAISAPAPLRAANSYAGANAFEDDGLLDLPEDLAPVAAASHNAAQMYGAGATESSNPFDDLLPPMPAEMSSANSMQHEASMNQPASYTTDRVAASLGAASANLITLDRLAPEVIDLIVRRVVEQMSERVVQEVAWEVVPPLAERMIKRRLETDDQGL